MELPATRMTNFILISALIAFDGAAFVELHRSKWTRGELSIKRFGLIRL
jgi:hypothetical protein